MYKEVELTRYEYEMAEYFGNRRQQEAVRMGLKDQHGLEQGNKNPLLCHIEGVCGEIACARILNVYWTPSVNTFKAPDLLSDLQVRTRGRHDYDLLVRPADKSEQIFVLVTGNNHTYRIHGWLQGNDCKQPRYKKNYGGRAAAYFVPQSDLHDLSSLTERIIQELARTIGIYE